MVLLSIRKVSLCDLIGYLKEIKGGFYRVFVPEETQRHE